MSEIKELIDILKRDVEKHGGLPDVKENTRFYARLLNLMDMAKEEGIKLTWSDIAKELGVSNALLRKKVSEYRRQYIKEQPVQQHVPQIEPEEITPPDNTNEFVGSTHDDASVSKEEAKKELQQLKKPSPVHEKVETRLYDRAMTFLGKKAEELAKEEVLKIIEVGKDVIEKYEKQCLASGFNDIKECIDAAFTTMFEMAPKYSEIAEKYEGCLQMVSGLLRTSDKFIMLTTILDKMKDKCSSDLMEQIIDEVFNA